MEYQVDKITKQIKIEKAIKKIAKTLVLAILIVILTINLIMFYQTSTNFEPIPRIGNIFAFNIVSESMEPTININDLIVVLKYEEDKLQKGDIVTYKREDDSIITHRIERISKENGVNLYITKGDNNELEDEVKIEYSQIYGKVIFKIKGAGKIAKGIQENNGLISVALIIIIFIILKNGSDKKKENRKKTREKYEIKKKRDEYNKKIG